MKKTNKLRKGLSKTNQDNTQSRQKQLNEEMKKTTITISLSHILWLDRLSSSIREKSHAVIDRGSIIRAILNALKKSQFNITGCSSEEEITDMLSKKLQKE